MKHIYIYIIPRYMKMKKKITTHVTIRYAIICWHFISPSHKNRYTKVVKVPFSGDRKTKSKGRNKKH